MVSYAGEAAVSGVSLVDMINVLLINIFAALATGRRVVTAQYLGRGTGKKACESADQLMVVTIVISIFIMGLTLLFQRPLLRLFLGLSRMMSCRPVSPIFGFQRCLIRF